MRVGIRKNEGYPRQRGKWLKKKKKGVKETILLGQVPTDGWSEGLADKGYYIGKMTISLFKPGHF